MMPFTFEHQKATQALALLASRSANSEINKMKALKLVFFADRYHLRKYGRPITGDSYVAMEYGPVASGTKDLAEHSDFLGEDEKAYSSQFLMPQSKLSFKAIAAPDLRLLSKSDVEALNWAWDRFGNLDHFPLSEYTHHYPEWKKWEETLKSTSRVPMDYRDFLAEPEGGADPCYALTEEKRAAMADGLADATAFASRW